MSDTEPDHPCCEGSDHKAREQLRGGVVIFGVWRHESEQLREMRFLRQDVGEEPDAPSRQDPDDAEHEPAD